MVKDKQLVFKLYEHEHEQIQECAKGQGKTVTGFIMDLIRDEIENIEDEKDKDEIYALKNEIVESINNTILEENKSNLYSKNTHEYITSEDINFNNMYKVYYDTNEILMKNIDL